MMARQFRILLFYKWMQADNKKSDEIVRILEIPKFALEETKKQSQAFSSEQLQHALENCVQIDYSLKNGQIRDEKAALEWLVLQTCKAKF
jgi:DNA polymerase-3 subunit delta